MSGAPRLATYEALRPDEKTRANAIFLHIDYTSGAVESLRLGWGNSCGRACTLNPGNINSVERYLKLVLTMNLRLRLAVSFRSFRAQCSLVSGSSNSESTLGEACCPHMAIQLVLDMYTHAGSPGKAGYYEWAKPIPCFPCADFPHQHCSVGDHCWQGARAVVGAHKHLGERSSMVESVEGH